MTYEWHRRAQDAIAQGALTNSKRPENFVLGVYPTHLVKGEGCFVYDTNNKKYIDYICALGTNILGYSHPVVNKAITDQLAKGSLLSLSTTLEVEVAENLKDKIQFVDKVRYFKTGTEACFTSIRIARAVTEKRKILSQGYHGFHDAFVSLTKPAHGVNPDMFIAEYAFDLIASPDVAAVILEPIVTELSEARIKELVAIREACTKYGVLLIFDEVITGFRFPKWTFAQYSGIKPDIICLGKAIANGMPLAAVGLSKSIPSQPEWFASGSYCGDTLSLAAHNTVINQIHKNYSVDDLWESGKQFLEGFNSLYPEKIKIEGYPTRGVFTGDEVVKALLWQEACKAGILFGPSWFYNFKHQEYNDIVLNSLSDIVTRIKSGAVTLQGKLPIKPFAQKVREKL